LQTQLAEAKDRQIQTGKQRGQRDVVEEFQKLYTLGPIQRALSRMREN